MQTALTFDPPPGDGSENDDQAQQAIDGDAATFWETETYRSDPVLSKGGVGLVLALPQRGAGRGRRPPDTGARVHRRDLHVGARGAARLAGRLGRRGTAARDLPHAAAIALAKPARARFVLVWITRLAPAEGSGFSARIAEATPLGS